MHVNLVLVLLEPLVCRVGHKDIYTLHYLFFYFISFFYLQGCVILFYLSYIFLFLPFLHDN